MYICNKCKKRFNKSDSTVTSMDTYYDCPYCNTEDFRELTNKELTFEERVYEHRKKPLEERVYEIEKKMGMIK